jgi:hypothetical protein
MEGRMTTTFTPEMVRRAGVALFGEEWQNAMAELLGVNERTVRRVAQAAREGTDYRLNPAWAVELRTALERAAKDYELQARAAAEVARMLAEVDPG